MNRAKKILLSLLVVVTLAGCKPEPVTVENTILNSENQMIQVGESLYYSTRGSDNMIYIVEQKRGKTKNLVQTGTVATSLNFYENALIYFDDDKLCKLDLKTKDVTVLTDGIYGLTPLLVKDQSAYYVEDFKLLKFDLEKNEKTVLVDNVLLTFDVSDGVVVYQSTEEEQAVIKKTALDDPAQTEILFTGPAEYISIQDDGIYFWKFSRVFPAERDEKLYKICADGSVVPVMEERISDYNIQDEWIYYANAEDKRTLYRIKKDGTENEKIIDKEVFRIFSYEDSLFCDVREETVFCTYKINPDTKEIEYFE